MSLIGTHTVGAAGSEFFRGSAKSTPGLDISPKAMARLLTAAYQNKEGTPERSPLASQSNVFVVSQHVKDHTPKWEYTPSFHEDSDKDAGKEKLLDSQTEEDDEPKTVKGKIIKAFKIAFPHFFLIFLLLSYTAVTALILMRLEHSRDIQDLTIRQGKIRRWYDVVSNETWLMRSKNVSHAQWSREVWAMLKNLSSEHESREFDVDANITTRWTFPTAVLYSLTVLTTCGYAYVEPQTHVGRVFAVAFALIGIPLMFITAADIGRFLAEVLIACRERMRHARDYIRKWCVQSRYIGAEKSPTRRLSITSRRRMSDEQTLIELLEEEEIDSLWFPILTYLAVVSAYSLMGTWLYVTWENMKVSQAFYFSFNLITTVGLGVIIVENMLYLCCIVAYVIIGLAVVTMCVDLASNQLKAYFTKIHYFGRAKHLLGMSEDLRDMLIALGNVRKTKGRVTWADLKRILEQQPLALRPFTPRHLHLWRFIDETNSSHTATIRHNSWQSDMICSSMISLRHGTRQAPSIHSNPPSYHHGSTLML